MKHIFLLTVFGLTTLVQAWGQSLPSEQIDDSTGKEYSNNVYRFSVHIPNNWKLFGQIINDTVNHKAIADWGLPLVYSDLEKTEIENSVSITAYRKADITSIEQLISSEYLRANPSKHALEVDPKTTNARIIYSNINGLNYKGKSYFVFNNKIGYVINFMATPGTFDKNIRLFEAFYRRIRFL